MNLGVETKQRNRLNFRERSGVSSYVINRINHTALSAFHRIIDSSMIEDIDRVTNEQAEYKNDSFRMTSVDLLTFIGCLFSSGLFSSGIAV